MRRNNHHRAPQHCTTYAHGLKVASFQLSGSETTSTLTCTRRWYAMPLIFEFFFLQRAQNWWMCQIWGFRRWNSRMKWERTFESVESQAGLLVWTLFKFSLSILVCPLQALRKALRQISMSLLYTLCHNRKSVVHTHAHTSTHYIP